jgi:hypothetical protein
MLAVAGRSGGAAELAGGHVLVVSRTKRG